MTTTSTQSPVKSRTDASFTPDVAEIRAEMTALTEQVKALAVEAGKDGATMARRIQDMASDTLGDMAETGGQVMQSMGKELASAQKQVVGAARSHPYQAIALLLGLGALVAILARR